MRKANGDRAKTDEENSEVFAEHFRKVFNNSDPPPCNDTVLPSVPSRLEFPHLGDPPSPAKVCSAIMCMANGKAPGPSGITSDAFRAMVFQSRNPDNPETNDCANSLCDYITEILCLFWEGNLDIESWYKGTLSRYPNQATWQIQINGDLFVSLRPCTRSLRLSLCSPLIRLYVITDSRTNVVA
eukprot:6413586-Ditylum_brightwellii.AAC.1